MARGLRGATHASRSRILDTNTTIVLSRLMAQQREMDVTANNLANATTPGFREERMQFSDWLLREPRGTEPPGGRIVDYTQDRATWLEQQVGPLAQTGNPLDLAIGNPAAWFTVSTANGPRLTRAGHFTLSTAGQVVDSDGNPLLDVAGQPLTLGTADAHITVAGDGTVSTENGLVGKIGFVTPSTTAGMQAEGGRLYLLSPNATTQPTIAPRLVQGVVEGSNVQAITELTGMMSNEREFQFCTQFVQEEADRQQSAIDKILTKNS
jgi:flagellar basal-body rod protein FlgF